VQEQSLGLEQWFVLRAKRPGVSAKEMDSQYGLEELPHYIERSRIERSRAAIDQRRGWEFAAKGAVPTRI
jgi:hypothetical protein